MKPKIVILIAALTIAATNARAGLPVIDPTNLIQNTLSAVKGTTTAANMVKNFNETVKIYQQSKKYYDALKKVHGLVKNARKVQQTILMVGQISDIYMDGYRRMLSDDNFTVDELQAIAAGYGVLLTESSNILSDLRQITTENGLSMNDSERMAVIDRCHARMTEYRALVQYYTNKNIGVSYLRAKKHSDRQRVLALYGTPDERYW